MSYWRFVALIGTVIFLYSGFLPLISIQAWIATGSMSLIDFYSIVSHGGVTTQPRWPKEIDPYLVRMGIGFFLTMILFPITGIAGFLSLISRKVALLAGILGILCWFGSIWGIFELKSLIAQTPLFGPTLITMIQFGIGIFTGILGAGILIASYFIGTHEARIIGTTGHRKEGLTSY